MTNLNLENKQVLEKNISIDSKIYFQDLDESKCLRLFKTLEIKIKPFNPDLTFSDRMRLMGAWTSINNEIANILKDFISNETETKKEKN